MASMKDFELPIVDLTGYIQSESPEEQKRVIDQVCESCRKYGFVQVKGHGVPLESQRSLFKGLDSLFNVPEEEKLRLSFLKNLCRRGYEVSGMTLRDGDALPDSKEAFYIGRDDELVEPPGFYGPNVWPDLPNEEFRNPAWDYYLKTEKLGRTMWEILLQGIGQSTDVMNAFAKRPMVVMKMLRYPKSSATLPGQFGVGAHTDFGGITVLLQQPGRDGLEVWYDEKEAWIPVRATEDILVINCGDIVQRWSGGAYKSAKHRVINKSDDERLSCATFWHGDAYATNPLNPDEANKETVGQLLVKRFKNQFSLSKDVMQMAQAQKV